ncbi:MAG: Hsp20/alpha crystallin family protein [Actinobacteria bacterium]|nr:Hsp20/alpha crystallin family protein [Actinomycetota bacterium]
MATLVRWDPFREVAQLQNELGRLFGGLSGQSNGAPSQTWVPALDVWETEDEIVYAFDLPGIPQDQISLEFEDGALVISAERGRSTEVERERYYRSERRYGSFSRTIGLPQGVDESSIRADYRDGVLEVHVTKPRAPEPRRIRIGESAERGTIDGTAEQLKEEQSA